MKVTPFIPLLVGYFFLIFMLLRRRRDPRSLVPLPAVPLGLALLVSLLDVTFLIGGSARADHLVPSLPLGGGAGHPKATWLLVAGMTGRVLVAIFAAMMLGVRRIPFSSAGLVRARWTWILAAIPVGLAASAISFSYLSALAVLGLEPQRQRAVDLMGMSVDGPLSQTLLTVGVVGVLAPWVEEWLYRGLFMGALRHRVGDLAAVVLVSVLFASAHFSQVLLMPPIFAVGLLLGWLRIQSGSLWPPVLAHFTFNAFAVARLLI